MNEGLTTLAAIIAGAFGVAIVAVLVSQRAQTGSVITSAGNALGYVIQQAVSPVTGSSPTTTGGGGQIANSLGSWLSNPSGTWLA